MFKTYVDWANPVCGIITSGSQNKMYTLRFVYNVYVYSSNASTPDALSHQRTDHVTNLSIDQVTAEEKASKICEQQGLELRSHANFELFHIIRNNSEEARAQAEREETEKREYHAKIEAEVVQRVSVAKFVSGKYVDQLVADVALTDSNYVIWLASNETHGVTLFDINVRIAKQYLIENPPKVSTSEWFSEIGRPIERLMTIKDIKFIPATMYGSTNVVKCEDEIGNEFSFFTVSKKFIELELGTKIKVSAIINDHKTFNDVKVTTLKKPKIIK